MSNGISQKQLMRLQDVIKKTGLKRSTLYNLIKTGDFPKQVAITKRCVGWVVQEVDLWIEQRIETSRTSRDTDKLHSRG